MLKGHQSHGQTLPYVILKLQPRSQGFSLFVIVKVVQTMKT